MAKKKEKPVSVLAYEKKIVPSDGYMYGAKWEERHERATPLALIEKSVKGTISNRFKKSLKAEKLDAEVEKANLQTVDGCALGEHQDTLKLSFTLKILSGVEHPSSCNNAEFNKKYTEVAKNYIRKYKFTELAKRYATNIANARFLWRNRIGAEDIEVVVRLLSGHNDNSEPYFFNAAALSTRNFDYKDTEVTDLAKIIASALSGKVPFVLLGIEAFARVGNAQEVYPSEELVLDKGRGKKSKILYDVNGVAGMHSQKIGNALRTIDTWYPEFEDEQIGPIAIEPYGTVSNLGRAFRKPVDKVDFYTLFDGYARGGALDTKEDEHYVMANLVRGGVFGESAKE